MALTDTPIKQVEHTGKPIGDKHQDSGGVYLQVLVTSKYCRI